MMMDGSGDKYEGTRVIENISQHESNKSFASLLVSLSLPKR